MDKAEIVFQKYAGVKWNYVKNLAKNIVGKGERYTKDVVKGEGAVLPRTPLLNNISKRYAGGKQTFIERQYALEAPSKNIGVSAPWSKEKKMEEVLKEKYRRQSGLS